MISYFRYRYTQDRKGPKEFFQFIPLPKIRLSTEYHRFTSLVNSQLSLKCICQMNKITIQQETNAQSDDSRETKHEVTALGALTVLIKITLQQ